MRGVSVRAKLQVVCIAQKPSATMTGFVSPKQQQCHGSLPHGLVLLRIIVLWCFISGSCVDATKHTFRTKDDTRFFIGPIGFPFGFLRDGSYNLTVFDYELKVNDKKSRNKAGKNNKKKKEKEIWQVEEENNEGEAQQRTFDAAFVLAKFRSNSQFERYTESLMENMLQICSFQISQTDSDGFIFRTENSEFHKDHNSIVLKMINSGIVSSNKNDTKATKSQNDAPSSIQHTFTNSNEEGLYVLFYQVCVFPPIANTSAAEALKLLQQYTVSSTFALDITLTNMYKGQISYLTAGELPLPKMYLLFSLAYAVLVVVWYRLLRSKRHTFYIHPIMALLLLLKIATLVSESAKYHFVRIYGHSMFWTTLYNFLAFLKGIVLFTTILLIGSGWR